MKGKLICFEGIDGAGKGTQIELLRQHLASQGPTLQVEVISFPRYGENLHADMVKDYLEGKFGNIKEVNPYLISLAFAGDRMLAKPQIEKWLKKGKLVIANRYVSSNKAHLGANLPENERESFFEWLDKLEYEENKLPKENLTILLNVDPAIGQQNVQTKHIPDLHENDLNHLNKACQIYLKLSGIEKNWAVVNCMSFGKIRSIKQIHQDILKILHGQIFRR